MKKQCFYTKTTLCILKSLQIRKRIQIYGIFQALHFVGSSKASKIIASDTS